MSPDAWIIVTAALVAGSCGFIGCFLILRRLAMVGDAISHSVLLGIVVAFLVTRSLGVVPMFIGAVLAGLLTTFFIEWVHRAGAHHDAAVGVTFTGLFALGVVLLTLFAGDVHLDAQHALYGELAYVPWDVVIVDGRSLGPRAVWMVGSVLLLDVFVTAWLFKEFKVCAFDPAFALTMGIPVTLIHYVQMTLVSLTTVAAFESVGAVLAVAMLIAPGAAAYLLTDRLETMLGLSVLIGVASAWTGYAVASALDVSISGAMATVAGCIFAAVFLLSPRYGVLAKVLHRRATAFPGSA